MRVLVVEDDALLRDTLKRDLERSGFAVDVAADGVDGEFLGASETYDAVVLDLGLPRLSGLEVLRRWRSAGHLMPVIVLTARDQWHERVAGLKAGADDYLGKPFHLEELLARLQALLRRGGAGHPPRLSREGVELDQEHQAAIVDGVRTEPLTALEFRLLRYLMVHSGQVVSKSTLGDHVYERDMDPDSNVIEVYINRLRRKIGKDLIRTRRGQGYVFDGTP
ncbi:response regulator transcription factor [Ideonella azotifigens]|uniref:Response regulator transcription factor n=1 Tax=Ideonella azotifigens TaxID=513160 RepID=A0ABN1JQJ7_9BURK|nr:response regulator transcription factor [Ideonella azotifigens]MCD2340187.1 response regulator transcription factor [Ideonella azotifigens]